MPQGHVEVLDRVEVAGAQQIGDTPVEAFDHAVGLGAVGPDQVMLDAVLETQGVEGSYGTKPVDIPGLSRRRLAAMLMNLGCWLYPDRIQVTLYTPPRDMPFEDVEAAMKGADEALKRSTDHWRHEQRAERLLHTLTPQLYENTEEPGA